jgi:hypothetical protein
MEKRKNGLLQPDGAYVKYLSHHGPLSKHLAQIAATS